MGNPTIACGTYAASSPRIVGVTSHDRAAASVSQFRFFGGEVSPRGYCVRRPPLYRECPGPLTDKPLKALDTGAVGSSAPAAAALSSADRARVGAIKIIYGACLTLRGISRSSRRG